MTTLDPTTRLLCQAIDQGDDSALPALADALEEAGDPRATGLQEAIQLDVWPSGTGIWRWWAEGCDDDRVAARDDTIVASIWLRLQCGYGGYVVRDTMDGASVSVRTKSYVGASAAFLALAEALI